MPVEFLPVEDTDPDSDHSDHDVTRRRHHLGTVVALAVAAAVAVVAWVVVRANDTDPGLTAQQRAQRFVAMAPLRDAADRYEHQMQCMGTAARALEAMPQAYGDAAHHRRPPAAREAAARAALAGVLNDGPGTPVYDTIASIWTANRKALLRHAPGILAELTNEACVRISG